MLNNILHFIKYNNATVIILAIVLMLGGGALAAGPEAIGQRETSVTGLDNTALLAADLTNFSMDFKIENIQADEKYYYVTYSFMDLAVIDSAWQYQLSQRTQKVTKKIKQDIGEYMAKFMAKHYEARLRELTGEKNRAESAGEQKRIEVTEYSGLVGRTLDLAAKVFPGYEPVVKRELPAPDFNLETSPNPLDQGRVAASADNLTQVYNDYVAAHPDLISSLELDAATTTEQTVDAAVTEVPAVETPAVPETPAAETPVAEEPANVEVIELPVPSPAEAPVAPEAPAPEATPTAEPAPVEAAPV